MEVSRRRRITMATSAKRVRDEGQNSEGVDRCSKKRSRSENWSAKETLQMLQLRKAIVENSTAEGSDAWNQIAQRLAHMSPESEARSPKQVAQRWDTLVRIYVSVEEQRCETGKSYGEIIDERQKRCKSEYRQLWHELISQGNPGKRRAGKAPMQPDEAPATVGNGAITQAPAPPLSPDASQAFVSKFGEIAKPLSEMFDIINRSIPPSEKSEVLGQASHIIVTGCNWEAEDDQGLETTISVRGLKKQHDETKVEIARATRNVADTMQSIAIKAASTSESFYLKIDQKDWSMVIESLSAISQKYEAISVQGIREEVGADAWIRSSQQQIISATRSTGNNDVNSIGRTLSLTSSFNTRKRTEKSCSLERRNSDSTASTFEGLSDIVHLSQISSGSLHRESFLHGDSFFLREEEEQQLQSLLELA